MVTFKLGTDAGDHVVVQINGRPDECDEWVAAAITIRAGGFAGSFDAMLMTCDFPRFRRQLAQLYETLDGTAIFDTMERQLRIECTGNGRGGIAVRGIAQDRAGDGNKLRFQFDMDQTFLRAIISDLASIESDFPNRLDRATPE